MKDNILNERLKKHYTRNALPADHLARPTRL